MSLLDALRVVEDGSQLSGIHALAGVEGDMVEVGVYWRKP